MQNMVVRFGPPAGACVCVCASVVWAGFRVGVLSSVHLKLKPVRLPYLQMEPPDVIAANPPFHCVIWLNSTVHNPPQPPRPSSVTLSTKSTNHCPPLPPLPTTTSPRAILFAAHHVRPMWCSPSITWCSSGEKYLLTTEAPKKNPSCCFSSLPEVSTNKTCL